MILSPVKSIQNTNTVIKEISNHLSKVKNTHTIILIGSYARGDIHEYSDIDMVLITDLDLPRSYFYSILPERLNIKELSLLPYNSIVFSELYFEGSIFMAHVLKEGKLLYDDGYFITLLKKPFKILKENLFFELQIIKQRLSLYNDLSIYGEIFIDCLSHLYSIAKNTAIIALASKGDIIFNKEEVFNHFLHHFPDLEQEIEELKKLKTFSLIWSKGAALSRPFSPVFCKDRTQNYILNLKKIIMKVEISEFKS